MISVKELVKNPRLPGSYFAPDVYIQGDLESGLVENRNGSRLIAIPQTLLHGLYDGLSEEVGSAASEVLYKCGAWWGKTFYRRFVEEVSQYYGKPLAELEMLDFVYCLKQSWTTHGWGTIEPMFDYYQQGFLVVKLTHSAFVKQDVEADKPQCFVEAGLLSSFFSGLTGQKLYCIQTACESMGSPCNYFVLGLSERVQRASAWLEEKHDHETIMTRLTQAPAQTAAKA
jgi:uncharacterized protein